MIKDTKYRRQHFNTKSQFYIYLSEKCTIREMEFLQQQIFNGNQNPFTRFVNLRYRKCFDHTQKAIGAMLQLSKIENTPESIRQFIEETGLKYNLSDRQVDLLCNISYQPQI